MKILEVDIIENVRVADSFVKYNKVGSGAGEARLYVGSKHKVLQFFAELNKPIHPNAFILKQNIKMYLDDAEFEYKNPSNDYRNRNDLENNYIKYQQKANDLKDLETFTVEFALDKDSSNPRCYIRAIDSDDKESMYTFLREILLPEISAIDIIKVQMDNQIMYSFIPRIDVQYNKYNHSNYIKELEAVINNSEIKETTKVSLIKSRIGQGEFRNNLINEMVACPVTFVDDVRLLVASHIKPWAVSNNIERLDYFNGLLLTPTLDKLFDQGLITFENPNKISYSDYLSTSTIEKLKLDEYKPNIIHFDKRVKYLEYHIDHVFKKLG